MSTPGPAPRFRLERFERTDTKASALLRLSVSLSDPDAHWIAQTGVLVVRRGDEEVARVLPLTGSSVATSSADGVQWRAAFGVRKSLLEAGTPVSFAIVPEGLDRIALPQPSPVVPAASPPRPPTSPRQPKPTAHPKRGGRRRAQAFALPAAVASRIHKPLLAALAAGAAAAASIALSPSPYSATASLAVTPVNSKDPVFAGLPVLESHLDPSAAVATAQGFVASFTVEQLAARRMGLGWTPRRVASHIKVSTQPTSALVQVAATADTPGLASRLANVYAGAALAWRASEVQPAIRAALTQAIAQLGAVGPAPSAARRAADQRVTALESLLGHGDPTIQLARSARLAARPGIKHDALIVLLAFGSGGLLGASAVWFMSGLGRRSVQTERKITELTGAPILARLPVFGVFDRPAAPSWVATRQLQGTLTLLSLAGERPRTIVLLSPSPGDGKTTAALALASHRAEKGEPVALLDLDWRKRDAARRLRGASALSEETNGPGWAAVFSAADANSSLVVGEIRVPPQARDVKANLDRALSMADLVVVDTPALSVASDGLVAAAAADVVLLVVQLERTPEAALSYARDALRRAGITPAGALVFMRRPPRREHSRGTRTASGVRT